MTDAMILSAAIIFTGVLVLAWAVWRQERARALEEQARRDIGRIAEEIASL